VLPRFRRKSNAWRLPRGYLKLVKTFDDDLSWMVSDYPDATGRTLPMFEITQDGFALGFVYWHE